MDRRRSFGSEVPVSVSVSVVCSKRILLLRFQSLKRFTWRTGREKYILKKRKKKYIYIYIYISVCVMKMFGVEHMFVKTFDMSGTKTCSAEQWVFSSVCEAHHKS